MNAFSETQGADDYCEPCQQANLFYLGTPPPQCQIDVTGRVNGLMTPMLPVGQIYPLPNTQPGTTNRLELMISGRNCVICENISDIGPIARPEDLKVAIGTAQMPTPTPRVVNPGIVTAANGQPIVVPPRRMMPIGRVSSARMRGEMGNVQAGHERSALDVMSDTAHIHSGGDMDHPVAEQERLLTSIQAHPEIGAPPFSGEKSIADLTPEEEEWLVRAALAVMGPIEWVDQVTGIAYLADTTGADMSLSGTNLPGVLVEAVEILLSGDKRRFLREMFGVRISKIWTTANGHVMVSFKGHSGLRSVVTRPSYNAANAKVSLIETAARTRMNAASAAKAVGSKAGVISIGFVVFFDVAEWLADPASERDVNELVATLLWDVGAVVVSIIAGALAAAALLALSTAGVAVGVLVAVAIGVGVVVGLALDVLENAFGLKSKIREALENATINDLDPTFYNEMMTAP